MINLMASSKLMTSSSSRNSDLIHRRPSTTNNFQSITSGGILGNSYADANQAPSHTSLLNTEIPLLDAAGAVTPISDHETNAAIARQQTGSSNAGKRTVDDVWKEIVAGRTCKQEVPDEMMTLEDFLAKAGAVDEEDVKVVLEPLPTARSSGGIYSYSSLPIPVAVDGSFGFTNGLEINGGRGKRKAILEPLDKAAQQRQKRMIKNRESAARSRERKQAYQVELESLVLKLEEEHEMLLKEKAEQTKERFKQLMKNIIPVVEKRRPARVLKRVRSMEW